MREKMLTTDQAAKAIGMSKATVLSWISNGILDAEKKEDGRWYTTKKDLDNAQALMTQRRKKRDSRERVNYVEVLKDDPVLMLVKAIVKDELQNYQNRLAKGLSTESNEAYIRSGEFARMTGGFLDPEVLIRKMRERYAR